MSDDNETHDERIEEDLEWLKNELLNLTNDEICIILLEYERELKKHTDIDMKEYCAFINLFNSLQDLKDD